MQTYWRNRSWRLRVAALLLSVVLVGLVQGLAPQTLSGAEEVAGDAAWRMGASGLSERRVVVVDIDEASLREVGPWPWPRTTLALLSQRLTQAGALVQAYDINFSDAKAGDTELREAWSTTSVVAGQLLSIDATVTPKVGVVSGALASTESCPAFVPKSHGYYGTSEELLRAEPAIGHLTPRIEHDGVVRKLPALICQDGKVYATLALTTLWRAAQPDVLTGTPAPDVEWHLRTDPGASSWGPAAWLTSRSLPDLMVPLDAQGDVRIPYRLERRALASVSAAEVLRGASDLGLLRGAVVLVGATAFGIGDSVATPHAPVSSGLEVHAQAMAGLLDHRMPYEPGHSGLMQVAAMMLIGAGLLLAAVRQRGASARRLPLAGLTVAVICWLGASGALLCLDLWLPWTSSALFAILTSITLATAEHAITRAQRERVTAHLGAYLPGPVAQRLIATDPTGSLQVDQRDVTVLAVDIRNFSAFAAHRPVEETAAILHAYSCIAVDVVEQHGGVVENVVGDSILAVWNAYSPCNDHPSQALEAAKELLRATRQLLVGSHPATEHGPVQPLALGAGLETGMAIVGSFGPTRRRAHAALGEPVSVATRIQQMTLDLSMPILIGPQLSGRLPAESTEVLGEYLLVGLSRHYSLYAPTAWAELVPVDPNWVDAATKSDDRVPEASRWSGWEESSSAASVRPGNIGISLLDA